MKLKTKLIPLATVAATSIIVAPTVLTSCGNGSIKLKDITKEFTPDFDQYAENPMLSQYSATTEYVNFVKNHKADFEQDVAYGIRENWVNFFDNIHTWSSEPTDDSYSIFTNAKITSIEFGIKNVKFGTKTIRFPGEEPLDYPTVSFNMKTVLQFELDGKAKDYDGGDVHQYTNLYTVENNTTYNDMLFFAVRGNPFGLSYVPTLNAGIKQHETEDSWYISFFDKAANEALRVATDWSLSTKTKITVEKTDKISGRKSTQTKETNNFDMTVSDIYTLEKLFDTITDTISSTSSSNPYAFQDLANQQGRVFFVAYGSMFVYKSYYFGNTFEAPYIAPDTVLSNYESRMFPDCHSYLYEGEDQLKLYKEFNEDTSLNGWNYVAPYTEGSESIQTQYDIGNITLMEDNDLFLPTVNSISGEPRYLHIPYNASLFDVNDYDKTATKWQMEMNRCIRLEAEIGQVEFDEYGKPLPDTFVPDGYTDEQLVFAADNHMLVDVEYDDDGNPIRGAVQFKFPKRQLKTQTEIYDTATGQLIQTNIGIIDLRPMNKGPHLNFSLDEDTTLIKVYYDWE